MSRPNLSQLAYIETVEMRRRLPFAALEDERAVQRRRRNDEMEGFEMPKDWSEGKKADFRAAIANLGNFYDEIEYEVWLFEDDDSTIDPDRAIMNWGEATETQKRAFGKALRLYHNENPDVFMVRVNGVLQHPKVEYEALLYAPHQWEQLFSRREPWNVEVESREEEGTTVMRLSKTKK